MIDKPSRPVDSSYLLELELQRWGYTSGEESFLKNLSTSPLGVVVVYRNDETTTVTYMVSQSRVDNLTNNLRTNEHNNNNQCSLWLTNDQGKRKMLHFTVVVMRWSWFFFCFICKTSVVEPNLLFCFTIFLPRLSSLLCYYDILGVITWILYAILIEDG